MVGVIAMTAAAAAVLFPTIKQLDPTLASFAEYPTDHWRIVAGQPANMLFQICDALSLGLLAVAALTLALRISVRPRFQPSASGVVRIIALIALLAATAYGAFVLDARMNKTARAFWAAAEQGQVDEADRLRDAFAADHPKSTVAMTVRLSFALVAMGAGLWNALPPTLPAPPRRQPARKP